MKTSKSFPLVLIAGLLSSAILAACGDNTATTPPTITTTLTPTTAAVTTTTAPATATTTTAPTTAPATTLAPTTAPATTAPATTASASTSGLPGSWQEVTLDPSVVKALSQGMPGNLTLTLKFYGSAEDLTTAANSGDSTLTNAGYKYAIAGETKPVPSQNTVLGLYTKAGAADILFTILDSASSATSLETNLKNAGVSQGIIDSTLALAKNYKSLITVVSGDGLAQVVLAGSASSSSSGSGSSATTTTAAASSTTASTSSSTTAAGGSDTSSLGLYPGATPLTLPDAITKQYESSVSNTVTNPQVAAFTTPDSSDKVKTYYVDILQKDGWTDLSAGAGASLSQLEGAGGFGLVYSKAKQVVVILGLPASSAAALGITPAPASGTLVLGFYGEAK